MHEQLFYTFKIPRYVVQFPGYEPELLIINKRCMYTATNTLFAKVLFPI